MVQHLERDCGTEWKQMVAGQAKGGSDVHACQHCWWVEFQLRRQLPWLQMMTVR